MNQPLIIFKDFTFQYYSHQKPTLTNINITIYEGQKLLIIGKNGSGKSTFLKCINGLIPHSYPGKITGSAKIKSKNLTQTTICDLSLDVGTIMQDTDNQFVGLTVAEDIAFALENDALDQRQLHQKVNQWADILGLKKYLEYQIQHLSEGNKQLVSMAGVLIYNPSILLFDEPLSNLDSCARKKIINLIQKIYRKHQNTILVVEHCLEDILDNFFDRVIVFEDGKIIYDMPSDQIIKQGILIKHGIQEPSYIKALRRAKINLTQINNLLNLKQIDIQDLKKKLMSLVNSKVTNYPQKLFSAKSPNNLLQLQNINYHYDKKNILNDISFDLKQGDMLSIVGANGCGKSTIGKIICGFITPQKGVIKWVNQNLLQLSIQQKSEKIGFVMQNPYHMISQKIVFEEVALGLNFRKLSSNEIHKQVQSILKICNLDHLHNWPIDALSFGQKKRVTIASILVLEPSMIILDEPIIGQDFDHYIQLMFFLEKLSHIGITILILTNDMSLMLEYTKKTIVLSKGKIIAYTTPVSFLTNSNLLKMACLSHISLIKLIKNLKISHLEEVALITKLVALNKETYLNESQ